jgi:alpha-beta hydrolase superfamily lysophospholipase
VTAYGPIAIRLPAGDVTGFGSSPSVAAWLFAPETLDPDEPRSVAFCIHGGGYSKRYFHIDEGAVTSYSMARHFAERGIVTVAIDCLGTAESSKAEAASHIVSANLTSGHHNAARHLLAGLQVGTLTSELPALPRLAAFGIGHSLGGMLLALQQARYNTFPRVAVLGWSNLGINLPPEALTPTFDETRSYAYGSAALRREFHLADVPAEALATTAERENLPVSLGLAAEAADRAAVHKAVAAVDVPVFLGFGEKDTSRTAHDEPSAYIGSNDVTLFVLQGSAHCHNFAGPRAQLWDRILDWAV